MAFGILNGGWKLDTYKDLGDCWQLIYGLWDADMGGAMPTGFVNGGLRLLGLRDYRIPIRAAQCR